MAGGLQKPRMPGSLKEAVADLVAACGHQSDVASLVRVSRSQLNRYTDDSDENASAHMPVDIVLALERHCGNPIVTRFLASNQARALVDINVTESRAAYPLVLSRIGRETGRLFAQATAAMADGKLNERETGKVRREALALMAACACLLSDLGSSHA
jgi:hypothetical protein